MPLILWGYFCKHQARLPKFGYHFPFAVSDYKPFCLFFFLYGRALFTKECSNNPTFFSCYAGGKSLSERHPTLSFESRYFLYTNKEQMHFSIMKPICEVPFKACNCADI